MPRILLILAAIGVGYYLYQRFVANNGFVRCGRCDGKGYWFNARERVTCDYCKGSGKMPRS